MKRNKKKVCRDQIALSSPPVLNDSLSIFIDPSDLHLPERGWPYSYIIHETSTVSRYISSRTSLEVDIRGKLKTTNPQYRTTVNCTPNCTPPRKLFPHHTASLYDVIWGSLTGINKSKQKLVCLDNPQPVIHFIYLVLSQREKLTETLP